MKLTETGMLGLAVMLLSIVHVMTVLRLSKLETILAILLTHIGEIDIEGIKVRVLRNDSQGENDG